MIIHFARKEKCEAAWAFVAAGLLEGQLYRLNGFNKTNNNIVSLSSQNLIDCSKKNDGCIGGSIEEALKFIKENNGINDDKSYPFRAAEQLCRFSDKKRTYFGNSSKLILKSYARLPEGNIDKLKEALALYGPVAAYMDASDPDFETLDYRTDVYYYKDCGKDKKSINHPILIVGYGTHPKKGPYWLVVSTCYHSILFDRRLLDLEEIFTIFLHACRKTPWAGPTGPMTVSCASQA